MIKLYHGSNIEIENIDLNYSRKGKDFGRGFYLNQNKQQALAMAERNVQREMSGTPIINAYLFDDSILHTESDLNIKVFDDYTEDWAEFILKNRNNNTEIQAHSYDIVIGPIANDTVGVQIRRFILGYISVERLIEELKFKGDHAIQYFFGTERAIKLLKKTNDE